MGKINNPYIKISIANQIMVVDNFKRECELSAKKNDGIIDKEERKILKKLNKLGDKYSKELKAFLNEE